VDEVTRRTTENAHRLFRLPAAEQLEVAGG